MDNVRPTVKSVTVDYFSQLTLEHLTQIWHATADSAIHYDLHNQHFNAMEPLMDYHIDGIDAAADDEAQSNLRRLVATSIYDLQLCLQNHIANL